MFAFILFLCIASTLEYLIFVLNIFSAYIKATAALCIITLITDVIATILTGLGLRTQNHNVKYKFYRIAVLVMLLSCKYLNLNRLVNIIYSLGAKKNRFQMAKRQCYSGKNR